MQLTYISHVTSENTGGGCFVDFIHLTDGRVLALNDECVCIYASIDAFYADTGEACQASMRIPSTNEGQA